MRALESDMVASLASWGEAEQVRLNMVLDGSGGHIDATGTSAGLSHPLDRRLLREIRHSADVLIVGAASLRAEGWHPLPHGKTLVLATRDSSLPTFPNDLVIQRRTLPSLSSRELGLLCRELRGAGAKRILCEGGPTLARLLLASGAVTLVNLTIRGSALDQAIEVAQGTFPDLENFTHERAFIVPHSEMTFARWRCATDTSG